MGGVSGVIVIAVTIFGVRKVRRIFGSLTEMQ
jgi:hypothetical protein